jgi:hypothetical protein
MNLERQARQAKFNRTIAFPMAVFGLLALAIAVCVVPARPDTPMPTRQGPPLAPVTTPTTTPRDDHPCLNNSGCPGYTPPRTATTPTTPDWSVYCYQHPENTMECGPATPTTTPTCVPNEWVSCGPGFGPGAPIWTTPTPRTWTTPTTTQTIPWGPGRPEPLPPITGTSPTVQVPLCAGVSEQTTCHSGPCIEANPPWWCNVLAPATLDPAPPTTPTFTPAHPGMQIVDNRVDISGFIAAMNRDGFRVSDEAATVDSGERACGLRASESEDQVARDMYTSSPGVFASLDRAGVALSIIERYLCPAYRTEG